MKNAAVTSMRLYLGSVDYASIRDQTRLYNRARKACRKLAEKYDISEDNVWKQVEDRARFMGVVRPVPGKDT